MQVHASFADGSSLFVPTTGSLPIPSLLLHQLQIQLGKQKQALKLAGKDAQIVADLGGPERGSAHQIMFFDVVGERGYLLRKEVDKMADIERWLCLII